jgi:hypothetical protein
MKALATHERKISDVPKGTLATVSVPKGTLGARETCHSGVRGRGSVR